MWRHRQQAHQQLSHHETCKYNVNTVQLLSLPVNDDQEGNECPAVCWSAWQCDV